MTTILSIPQSRAVGTIKPFFHGFDHPLPSTPLGPPLLWVVLPTPKLVTSMGTQSLQIHCQNSTFVENPDFLDPNLQINQPCSKLFLVLDIWWKIMNFGMSNYAHDVTSWVKLQLRHAKMKCSCDPAKEVVYLLWDRGSIGNEQIGCWTFRWMFLSLNAFTF